jgi:hypothetical protein
MKKLLLILTALTLNAYYGFSQAEVKINNLGTIIGLSGPESTGFSIYFTDSTVTDGAWIDNNPLGATYTTDDAIEMTLPADPTGTLSYWQRGDLQINKSDGAGGFIPIMLGNGNNKVQFTIKTPDTLAYNVTVDHSPWASGNPQLIFADTIAASLQEQTITATLVIPANLTTANNLNSTFYNTFYLYLNTINRKSTKVKLYEIHVGDQVTAAKIVKPNEVNFGSLLHDNNVVSAEGINILGQCIGKSQTVAGINYPKGISFVKATMKDGSSVIAKVYR